MNYIKYLSLVLLAGTLLLASGCTKEEKTVTGAALGAGTGALIGSAAGKTGGGIAGAALGGIAGGLIGHSMGDDK
jgi:uncharacterized protein YcfJ